MRITSLLVTVLAASMMVSACGGGGGGGVPDTTAPTFLAGDPDESNTHCKYFDDSTITASFDEAVKDSTIDLTSFVVTDLTLLGRQVDPADPLNPFDFSNPTVPKFIAYVGSDSLAGLSGLIPTHDYAVTISTLVTDLRDNPLTAQETWLFTIDTVPPCLPTETWNNDPLICDCQ